MWPKTISGLKLVIWPASFSIREAQRRRQRPRSTSVPYCPDSVPNSAAVQTCAQLSGMQPLSSRKTRIVCCWRRVRRFTTRGAHWVASRSHECHRSVLMCFYISRTSRVLVGHCPASVVEVDRHESQPIIAVPSMCCAKYIYIGYLQLC